MRCGWTGIAVTGVSTDRGFHARHRTIRIWKTGTEITETGRETETYGAMIARTGVDICAYVGTALSQPLSCLLSFSPVANHTTATTPPNNEQTENSRRTKPKLLETDLSHRTTSRREWQHVSSWCYSSNPFNDILLCCCCCCCQATNTHNRAGSNRVTSNHLSQRCSNNVPTDFSKPHVIFRSSLHLFACRRIALHKPTEVGRWLNVRFVVCFRRVVPYRRWS